MMKGSEHKGLGFLVWQVHRSHSSCLQPFSEANFLAPALWATAQWTTVWDHPVPRVCCSVSGLAPGLTGLLYTEVTFPGSDPA